MINQHLLFLAILLTTLLQGQCNISIRQFNEKEIECLKDGKVYYPADELCYELKKKGPCDEGQWLVLDKSLINKTDSKEVLQPVCKDAPCEGSLLYWERTKSCIRRRDKDSVCGNVQGVDLGNNVFGEGECVCKKDHARMSSEENGPCYPLYHQGPCPLGMIFGYRNADQEEPECLSDRCYNETLRRKLENRIADDAVLALADDEKCYEIGTTGPCPESAIFKVHSTMKVPACISPTNQIFQFERPENCYGDENGKCQKVIKIKSKEDTAEKYMSELFNSVNSLRKRRWVSGKKNQKNQYKHTWSG